ncbi:glycosyltransferase family 2 protein [Pedobacter sp. Leaf216]|uniref:glycosyltransferase family 2 protein n=1 Tax=Pedobacter sp. Leaf216 TaxID=1735684 RepID=UPI001F3207B7|nr:galactosyltransferase-related protein [Pedobacter sp. Leaf216]
MRNRKTAILNLIAGLCNGIKLPGELIIVHMNEEIYGLADSLFPIKEYKFSSEEPIPLASARNFAASKAVYDQMIFLDADCIPSTNFVQVYENSFSEQDSLLSGRIEYLSRSAMDRPDLLDRMHEVSTIDPIRGNLDQYPYHLFWSINFGCSKNVYSKIGGFDENFVGYGAEDTDFAFSAKAQGINHHTIDATAYHQYHPSYDPPLNHLNDVVKNASLFNVKWGMWPMQGWLDKFCAMGFTEFENGKLQILKYPTGKQIEDALKHT